MGIRQLRVLAKEWQAKLGLTEWEIKVAWGKLSDSPDPAKYEMYPDCEGNTWWFTEDFRVIILIRKGCEDLEGTLVHELLHVLIEGHRTAPAKYDPLYERAINKLTKALLRR